MALALVCQQPVPTGLCLHDNGSGMGNAAPRGGQHSISVPLPQGGQELVVEEGLYMKLETRERVQANEVSGEPLPTPHLPNRRGEWRAP